MKLALLFAATLSPCSMADIELSGTLQAIASRSGDEDRNTLDLSTLSNPSGTLNAVFQQASASVTVNLSSGSTGSSVHVVHALDSGDIPVGGSSSDGMFTFTVPQDTRFQFSGILDQQSTDPAGGGSVRIRNTSTFVFWFQAFPDTSLSNNPIDFSVIPSSSMLDAGTYELTWFHAANRTSSNDQTTADADFMLTLVVPGCSPADFNADGVLDFFDISAFLSAFIALDPSADLNNDGSLDFFDIASFLQIFAQGCS